MTVNSLLRNVKALLEKKILPFIEQTLPSGRPLPFEGVTLEKAPSLRYRSKIDAFAILARASHELATAKPEAFKVIALALACGLRSSKKRQPAVALDRLRQQGDSDRVYEYQLLKSENSAGEIDLEADILGILKKFRADNLTALS